MPAPPPRDADGKIVPHDHSDILGSHHVIRHTTPNDLHSEGDGTVRLASGAFSESSAGGMSVDIEDWMAEDGLHALYYVVEPTHGAVRLNVGQLRELGFKVGWDPDGGHKHHGAVWGIGNGSPRKRRIRAICETIRPAEGETFTRK
jgi:hypothetical protein